MTKSAYAIISLITGILGIGIVVPYTLAAAFGGGRSYLITPAVLSILALFFSIVGLIDIANNNLAGKLHAIVGLILALLNLTILLLLVSF